MIETERLILRPWEETDAEAMFKYASDPDIGPIAGWPPHTSVENSREIIRTVFAAPETYAVVQKATGEPVGSCGIMFSDGLHSAEMKPREAEIGYWIGKPYWGQGLIPEAVKALLARCFNDLHLDAAWCGYYDGNTKSKRVIEKCGFKFHHTNKDIVSPLGDIRTEHFYIMTKEDYRAVHTTAGITIRQERQGDLPVILDLVEKAFENVEESDHQEQYLVERLHGLDTFIPELSLVAVNGEGIIVGYILLTKVKIVSADSTTVSLAVAPLAVHPAYQNNKIGGMLIEEAHKAARAMGYGSAVLLGHKDYYPRFGYRKAIDYGIRFPFDAPQECCMVIELLPDALNGVTGTVRYPECFQ
jgi:hypothetical protein BACCOPRO_02556